jgi:two-component system cell cycle sensor histidine kinase/response regulator CckA
MSDRDTGPFISSLAHHAADPFRLLVNAVVDYGIFMLDPAGHVASWNPAAERIFGYRPEEIIGKHFSCLYTAEDIAAGEPDHTLKCALEGRNHSYERLRVRKDNSQFWAVTTVSNLKDFFGNHAGFAEITRDITERKLAQVAVRRERDLAAAMLRSLPGVYYMYDETGHFIRWNRRFEEVTEYSAEEIDRLHPLDFFEGEDKKILADRIESVFRTGSGEVEAAFVSKSGRRTPYYFNGVRAEVDGRHCLLGMGIDISLRKQSEEALRATDQRFRMAATAANVGLWDWDLRTNEVYYSPEWKSQIGYRESDIGSSFEEWRSRVHPDDLEDAQERMRVFIANPSLKYNTEFRLRHRDGSYRWILSQAALLLNEQGTPIHMLGSHVDVTEQRQEEGQRNQAQKMEAVGRLAGGVAHDFNNLLTIIIGYGDMLAAGVTGLPNLSKLADEINRAADRAAGLTRQLLAFSRQQVMVPKVLDLNLVIGDINRMLQRLIGEDVEISINQAKGLDQVMADPGQIEQVIVNLAVNARDAMPAGGRLTIETANVELDESYASLHPEVKAGRYVMLAVSDTGTGMDERTRAHIFEPFFTTKERGKGTGLGLSTVYGIVKQSGGHIWLYSEPGLGTTFKIYLPRGEGDREPDQNHAPERYQTEVPRGSETVLLVEDDASLRLFISSVLRDCGYRILEAQNGIEAITIAEEFAGTIDFVLTDVVMPKMGGRELSAALAARRRGIKILYMSGYTSDTVVLHEILEARMPYLQKPFTAEVLARKVRDLLDSRD